ncbi:hypothetical protein BC629DRAFT_1443341 [Irpex lacteus]|nr:hypothetical protein BC629DRAFT_1443341 [Irpex lacteus]
MAPKPASTAGRPRLYCLELRLRHRVKAAKKTLSLRPLSSSRSPDTGISNKRCLLNSSSTYLRARFLLQEVHHLITRDPDGRAPHPPGELAKHAISEGTKSVTKWTVVFSSAGAK